MKITVNTIVKNEANHIGEMLESVRGLDVCIADTGSEDDTVEIIRAHGGEVWTDYRWNDNFAEARNHALSKVAEGWCLVIDADETLVSPVERVREEAEKAEAGGFKTVSCLVRSRGRPDAHRQPRLFKRCAEVYWKGAAHNYLSVVEANDSDITVEYGYSDQHAKDPDRTLRILTKAVAEDPSLSREKYYLAREYYYRRRWEEALHWWEEYQKVARWVPELADAYLLMARCLWYLRRGNEARAMCLQAINCNPDFREALLFMAEMHFEPFRSKWQKIADQAENKDVLFIRGPAVSLRDQPKT